MMWTRTSLLAVLYAVATVHGVTEYFSWSHAKSYTSDIRQYVLDNFETDTSYSFGWKFSSDTDSLKLARDPDGSGYVLNVYYQHGTRTSHDTNGHGCSSSKPCHRGAQFYIMPPQLTGHGHTFAALEYEVYFERGFEFVKGGKLPGLYGGRRDSCKGCSGEAHGCFSTRLMWRSGGHYEVYAYIPRSQDGGWSDWCHKYRSHDKVICNDQCGTEIGLTSTDDHKFEPEQWYRIRQEVNLGNPNQHGRISLWVDGKLTVLIKNIVMRTSSSVHIEGVFFSTFYGGSDVSFGKHGDTYAYFRNFRVTDEKYTIGSSEVFVG